MGWERTASATDSNSSCITHSVLGSPPWLGKLHRFQKREGTLRVQGRVPGSGVREEMSRAEG